MRGDLADNIGDIHYTYIYKRKHAMMQVHNGTPLCAIACFIWTLLMKPTKSRSKQDGCKKTHTSGTGQIVDVARLQCNCRGITLTTFDTY